MVFWRFFGASVRGAAHLRSGLPNQDALFPLKFSTGPALVVSVADGHGSSKYFRSSQGARFAVRAARKVLEGCLDTLRFGLSPSQIKGLAEERLPRDIVRQWSEWVDRDVAHRPFTAEERNYYTDGELQILEIAGEETEAKRQQLRRRPYGSTLLSVIATPEFLLFLQLGDGDILTISSQGVVSRPLPRDPRFIGNETVSLCQPGAWKEFSATVAPLSDPPDMILLSSDGYANSYPSEDEFLKVGADLWGMMQKNGRHEVEKNMERWLEETSAQGCGDDITVAILERVEEGNRAVAGETIPEAKINEEP